MKCNKYVYFFIVLLAILSISVIIIFFHSNTKERKETFEQSLITQNESATLSTCSYDMQENVLEYEFKRNALSLLELYEQDIITEKINETQFKIKINKDLNDIEYLQICELLDNLKYFYYPDDTITIILVLPSYEMQITPTNPVEATHTEDEIVFTLEEVTKFK